MRFRNLGKTGIRISEIGLGTWEMSGDVWGKKDDLVSLKALQTGIDHGANFIDTAAGYGSGHVEELIGTFLHDKPGLRDNLVISTKVKPECGQFAPPSDRDIRDFFSPAWIRKQCEISLSRMGTDYIDILFLHTWSGAWGHETEWCDELVKLKKEGKVRSFGISIPDEGIRDANVQIALESIDVIQCVFNVFQQEPIYSLFPLAAKHGIGIIARSPFSSGALVQNWSTSMQFEEGDWRGIWPHSVKPGWLQEQIDMFSVIKPLLMKSEEPFPIAALQFILTCPEVSSVIPGSADPLHIITNLSASESSLTIDIVNEIRKLWKEQKVHGTYNGSI